MAIKRRLRRGAAVALDDRDTRRRLEDAIETYARSYAGYVAKVAMQDLPERDWQRIMSALELHEAAIKEAERAAHP